MHFKAINTIVLSLFAAAMAVVWFTPDIKSRVTQWLKKPIGTAGPVVALITDVAGEATIHQIKTDQSRKAKANQQVHHLERLKTASNGQMTLSFSSGYQLDLLGDSEVILELWNPTNVQSPVYAHWVRGRIQLIQEGTKGKLYILRQGRLFLADQISDSSMVAFNGPDTDLPAISEDEPPTEVAQGTAPLKVEESEEPSKNSPSPQTNDEAPASGPLTDAYIDSKLEQQADNFRKCQVNSLKKNIKIRGEMLIGIEIDPQGKVSHIKALKSDIINEEFTQCIVTAIRRIRFKPFEGHPILRSYPLRFQ